MFTFNSNSLESVLCSLSFATNFDGSLTTFVSFLLKLLERMMIQSIELPKTNSRIPQTSSYQHMRIILRSDVCYWTIILHMLIDFLFIGISPFSKFISTPLDGCVTHRNH